MFISFEGPEGAGKTAAIEALKLRYPEFVYTREPGGIELAEKIRNVILHPEHTNMHPHTEALLYAAARAQHFYEKIEPALTAGNIVVCDRFIDSSLAYQGYARGIAPDAIRQINTFAIGERLPDYTIYLDVPAELGLARIARNERETNRLDRESISFHRKVCEGYKLLIEQERARFFVIDATQSKQSVTEDIEAVLTVILEKRKTSLSCAITAALRSGIQR